VTESSWPLGVESLRSSYDGFWKGTAFMAKDGAKNMRLLRTRDAFKLLHRDGYFCGQPRHCQDLAELFLTTD